MVLRKPSSLIYQKLKIVILIGSCCFLQSCFFGSDGGTKQLISHYYVSGTHKFENVHLGYEDKDWGGIGLIPAPITAISYDNQFIIIKREPENTEFYIIKIVATGNHSDAEKGIVGPLTEKEFLIIKQELGVNIQNWKEEFRNKNGY